MLATAATSEMLHVSKRKERDAVGRGEQCMIILLLMSVNAELT